MTFSHLTHPLRHKMSRELLIMLLVSLLLVLAILVINLIHRLPQERAVPAPVVASPTHVPVHFSKLQGSTSITEATERPFQGKTAATPLQSALQQLLAGPTAAEKEAGYYSEIPQGTHLLGVSVKDNIVHINLSKEFTSGGGSTSMIQRVNELKTTVADVEGDVPVQIAIEGKPLHVLGGEGLELD